MAPAGDIVEIFYTKESPKAEIYKWMLEQDEFIPTSKLDRSSYNILVQNVLFDSLIEKTFYKKSKNKS
jgi:hypothetical protein